MHVIVSSKNIELTEGLKTFVTTRLEKMSKYFPGIVHIRVFMDVDRKRKGVDQDAVVELVSDVQGQQLVVKDTGRTFYVAFFGAVAKLKKRLRRERDKVRR